MSSIDYIGFDIHKKTISFCAKAQDGTILDEGTILARRNTLLAWAKARPRPWIGAMEATLFTGWIYDLLKPLAQELKVAHPAMLKAIVAAKKKNDKVDARTIAICCGAICCRSATWRRARSETCGGCCATAIWWCARRRG